MIYLFVHQNFPGQYVHLVRHLAADPSNRVYFITQANDKVVEGVERLVYRPEPLPRSGPHPYNLAYEAAVRTGLAVMQVCRGLRASGIVPGIVVGHGGWGETLFVKDVFADTPVLTYFEFFYHARGADVAFDQEFSPPREDNAVRLRLRNAINWMCFSSADWGHTATHWQRGLFPPAMRRRITVLHEGIDTERICPDANARLELAGAGRQLTRADEVVTYVARNLEPYRGFHWFMRALPGLLRRRPRLQVLVVGGDGVSYGEPAPYGGSYREMMLTQLGDSLDRTRVHFLGQVPPEVYLRVLQVSTVHVYFTYPFVLSWSLLEAMSAGCAVLGSANPPVDEVMRDGENGLLGDVYDSSAMVDRIERVLNHPDRMQALRDSARATIIRQFDLRATIMPKWLGLLDDVVNRRFPEEAVP